MSALVGSGLKKLRVVIVQCACTLVSVSMCSAVVVGLGSFTSVLRMLGCVVRMVVSSVLLLLLMLMIWLSAF